MTFTRLRSAVLLLALLANTAGLRAADGVVVIGHASIKRLDTLTLARIYTGRVIEVDGISVTAINANAGSDVRTRFLQMFRQRDED